MGAPPLIHPVVQERGLLLTHFPAQLPRCGHLVTVERFLERLLSFLILLKLFEFMPLSLRCPPECFPPITPQGHQSFALVFFLSFFLLLKQMFDAFTPIENLWGLIVLSS